MANECDNFGDFFIYRLENLLSKDLKKDVDSLFCSISI